MLLQLLLLAPLAAPPPPAAAVRQGERLSLEELLERYRARRDARLGLLRDQVQALVAEIDAAPAEPGSARAEEFIERLSDLGSASAPLLVASIDPGPDAADAAVFRAQIVTRVLREMPNFALTDDLLGLLDGGTRAGQLNALRVLARSEDPDRASPALREYHGKVMGARREAALIAIAELGGADNEAFLGQQLGAEDGEVVRAALRAVAAAECATVAPQVLTLVRARTAAAAQVSGIVAYFRACPETVAEETAEELLALARWSRTSTSDAVKLLELLGDHDKSWSSSLKRDLKSLSESGNRQISEAALIALVRSGDRGAKRQLLEPYDERVADAERWAGAYEDRGNVLYRIEDWKGAKKDYEEALSRDRNSSRNQADLYVQVARCCAQLGKLKDAKEWLDQAPITLSQLRALALDPVFAELAAHSRYRDVFRLE